jgi:hypothetical protein
MLATGLCSVAGMLPDLDSDSGVPFRESVAFLSAFVPVMLIGRLQPFEWSRETVVLAAGLIYIAIRFGVAEIFRRYTVHRGMWHSLPAAASAGLFTFLICETPSIPMRLFWSTAVVAGFLSHLLLDEIYSVDLHGMRLKKSFGTALKLWTTRGWWPNVSTYGKLALLVALAWCDPVLMEHLEQRGVIHTASQSAADMDISDGEGPKLLR